MASSVPILEPPLQKGVEQLTELDIQPLSPQIKSLLAEGLIPNTWKEFARATELIPMHEIDLLDSHSGNPTEKCYQMLTKWEQLSQAQVTVGMTKLLLLKIGRNDLYRKLSSLMGDTPTLDEFTLRDLSYSQIREIASFLDNGSSWKGIGIQIFRSDKVAQEIVETLHTGYVGRKSPAKLLFEVMLTRNPQLSTQKIIDIARVNNRLDIAGVLRHLNLPSGYRFSEVPLAEQLKINRLLNKNPNAWRIFAAGLGLTKREVDSIVNNARVDTSHSPTESLLELIKTRKPDFTLDELQKAASNIDRNDVALVIRTIITELGANITS